MRRLGWLSRLKPLRKPVLTALLFLAISAAICFGVVAVMNIPSVKTWLGERLVGAEVDITDIDIEDFSLTNALVDITMEVENTKPSGVILDRIEYVIYFQEGEEWVQLGKAERTDDVVIRARSSTSFDITNDIEVISIIRAFYQAYSQDGSITLKVAGSAWVKLWPMTFEMPFEQIKTVGC